MPGVRQLDPSELDLSSTKATSQEPARSAVAPQPRGNAAAAERLGGGGTGKLIPAFGDILETQPNMAVLESGLAAMWGAFAREEQKAIDEFYSLTDTPNLLAHVSEEMPPQLLDEVRRLVDGLSSKGAVWTSYVSYFGIQSARFVLTPMYKNIRPTDSTAGPVGATTNAATNSGVTSGYGGQAGAGGLGLNASAGSTSGVAAGSSTSRGGTTTVDLFDFDLAFRVELQKKGSTDSHEALLPVGPGKGQTTLGYPDGVL